MWYLLDTLRVWQRGVQIYYITAFRLPKHRLNKKRKTKLQRSVFASEDKLIKAKLAVSYIKKITMVRNQYKLRQPLFAPVINSVRQQQKILKNQPQNKYLSNLHKVLLKKQLRGK